jgi:hypothetical protein
MNGMRKVLCILMAMTLAMFALPSTAQSPQKIFSLKMDTVPPGGSVTAGATGVMLSATFRNETPNGNSSINSAILTVPTGMTVTGTSFPNGGHVDHQAGQNVYVNGFPGVGSGGQTWSFNVTVNVASSPGCAGYTFQAQAFTGNSFGGQPFAYLANLSQPTIGVTGACALRLVSGRTPNNAVVNAIITSTADDPSGPAVQVEEYDSTTNARVTSFTGSVSLAEFAFPGSGTGALSGGGAVAAVAGVATFPSLKINATGDYKLQASSGALSSSPSPQFTIFGGDLFCGDALGLAFTNPNNLPNTAPGYAAGSRGANNKDSSTCVKVDYTFTNTILIDDTVHLKWDLNVQPNAAFIYTMNSKLKAVDGDGWTAKRPKVAWLESPPGTPIFVPGLACLSPGLPAPYGTLAAAITDAQTSITVNATATLPGTNFPIVIGTERMQVSAVSGGPTPVTLTVARHQGGTIAAAHFANDSVMSTPLPIIPDDVGNFPSPYVVLTQAHMCIASRGWVSTVLDANGNPLVEYFTTVIDIGDGWTSDP